ncbi:MAG: hypothetical protein IPI21_14830 [Propionivibrio sp.]|nr:hypothetical protein [Propionivibrio sp.]
MMEPTRLADWDHAGLALAHAARSPWLDSLFAPSLAGTCCWRCCSGGGGAATGTRHLSRWR